MGNSHKNKNQQKPAAQAPAAAVSPQGEEPKGLLERAGDAISHALHLDAQPSSEPDLVESSEAGFEALPEADQTEKVSAPAKNYREHQKQWLSKKERLASEDGSVRGKVYKGAERCPTEQSDFEQHPKFSKFKKGVN